MSYYVTVQHGDRSAFLAGPFRRHGDALHMVDAAAREAERVDREAHWFTFGTAHDRISHQRVGRLNERLGLVIGADGFVCLHVRRVA